MVNYWKVLRNIYLFRKLQPDKKKPLVNREVALTSEVGLYMYFIAIFISASDKPRRQASQAWWACWHLSSFDSELSFTLALTLSLSHTPQSITHSFTLTFLFSLILIILSLPSLSRLLGLSDIINSLIRHIYWLSFLWENFLMSLQQRFCDVVNTLIIRDHHEIWGTGADTGFFFGGGVLRNPPTAVCNIFFIFKPTDVNFPLPFKFHCRIQST